MTASSADLSALRRNQTEALKMARLSPFKADKARFLKIADAYGAEADLLMLKA